MRQSLAHFRTFPRTVQVLLASQLAINTGFFVLYPYLAGHLQRELGLSAGVLGLVLGIGTLSQQGLFLVGGTLSDRLGPRPAIIGGLLIRSIGFLAFAFASSLPLLIVAAFLSGFAGALFNPAVRAYLAHAAGPRRVEAFALFGVFANAGLLLGPVVGGFLVQLDFVVAGVSAAALFVCLAVVQARVLPPAQLGGEPDVRRPVLNDWRAALRNRPFVLFALGMLGYFALYVQFYLALPLAARRATPDELGVSSIFVLSAVLGIVAQVPVTAWSERHWTPPRAIAIGLLVMGGAFAFMCAWTALPIGNVVLLQLGSVLAATAVLTFGTLIAQPFALDLTVSLAHTPRLIGTYFAFYYLSLGIGGAAGNVLAGWSFDVAHTLGLDALPWLVLASIGLGSAAVVLGLERRGLLTAPQELR